MSDLTAYVAHMTGLSTHDVETVWRLTRQAAGGTGTGRHPLEDFAATFAGITADQAHGALNAARHAGWRIVRFHESYEPIPIAEEWTP